MNAGDLRYRIRIERPVADDSFTGAGSASWQLVASVRAQVQDMLPSRGEKLADGLSIATRPARVRIRYRNDIDASMRVVMGDRVMQIVSAPAEIGNRDGLEFMAEDYSTAGGGG
ncbi:head-tail adaptor protein [Erythrobacteraceae bacterium CFH 75059]|uniref:phage head closure protein n=1 Tax=Qipengyuania thermophila TaxID=2509361 RepID=UPI0010210BC8|nr:phage head closure protein [Qipengyuania thermophila]TCD04273.1 head-tail adaptor protein [Erythrobacteraceae bacterium CFH 75059]